MLIFFGFLAVQPHSLELMLRGVFPGAHVAEAIPRVYGAYLFVADIMGFLVLAGLGYALYRRLVTGEFTSPTAGTPVDHSLR